MQELTFEGISFNVPDIRETGLTEKEFIQRSIWEGKYAAYSMADREKLLKEAFRLIHEKK